jgi:hypothetical protein
MAGPTATAPRQGRFASYLEFLTAGRFREPRDAPGWPQRKHHVYDKGAPPPVPPPRSTAS